MRLMLLLLRPIILLLILLLLALTGCGESQGQKFRRFAAYCLQAGFQPDQCLFLWAMQQNNASDQSQAFVTGLAVGIATGTAGSSKAR